MSKLKPVFDYFHSRKDKSVVLDCGYVFMAFTEDDGDWITNLEDSFNKALKDSHEVLSKRRFPFPNHRKWFKTHKRIEMGSFVFLQRLREQFDFDLTLFLIVYYDEDDFRNFVLRSDQTRELNLEIIEQLLDRKEKTE